MKMLWKRVVTGAYVAAAPLLMAVPAFATEGAGSSAASGMTSIIAQTDTVVTMSEEIWNLLTGNPYLSTYLAVGLLGVGFGVFRRAKRAARH